MNNIDIKMYVITIRTGTWAAEEPDVVSDSDRPSFLEMTFPWTPASTLSSGSDCAPTPHWSA